MKRILAIATLFVLAVAPFAVSPQTSSAQYPPPVGSITLLTSTTMADAGEDVTLTGLVRNEQGHPVANTACAFSIVSQPGDDASLGSTSGTTNAQGMATTNLNAGSTAGTIVVSIGCGELASTVLVNVVAGVQSITPPSTGDGGLAGS